MFPPIFVADTKIIYGYNFVAPLNNFSTFISFLIYIPMFIFINRKSLIGLLILPLNATYPVVLYSYRAPPVAASEYLKNLVENSIKMMNQSINTKILNPTKQRYKKQKICLFFRNHFLDLLFLPSVSLLGIHWILICKCYIGNRF